MLSDEQIDSLEKLIVFSTMDQLPLILSRAIPVLFSELRLVKATLDSKVNNFLEGIGTDDRPQYGDGDGEGDQGEGFGPQGADREGVPSRGQHLVPEEQVRTTDPAFGSEATSGGDRPAPRRTKPRRSNRGGDSPRTGPDEIPVVGGDSQQEMGGALPIQSRDPR